MALDGLEAKEITRTLEQIKSTLFEKADQLEKQAKKLAEDAVTKAELAKVNKALDDLKDETKKKLQRADDDIHALHKKANRTVVAHVDQKTAANEVKANLTMAKMLGREGDAAAGAAMRTHYKSGFDKWARGDRTNPLLTEDEKKAISVGSGPDGGLYVEPARADYIIQRMRETSAMRDIASVVSITSNSYKISVDRDDVGYGWVGENTSRPATTTPQFGEIEIPVHEMYAMPSMSQNSLDDMGIDIESLVNDKVLNRFGRAENTAFVTGATNKSPTGFLSQIQGTFVTTADATRAFGALQYIATGVSGGFASASATVSQADKLLDLIYAFNAAYRSSLTWTMNRTTLGAVRKIKDQLGNYIFDPKLTANGIVDMVLGYPVKEFADMADFTTANAFAIALGDFRQGYQIVDRQGIRQLRDPLTVKGYVLFYTTKRTGGAITNSDAIKVLKFGVS